MGSHPLPPARPRRHTLTLQPHGGMATPKFHRARWTDRLPARPGSCHLGYSSQPLPLYLVSQFTTGSVASRSSSSAVRCNPPRFEVLPHRGVYCRCRKLCIIGARLRAPELGLGGFAPRRRFSRNAARLAGRGILQAASVPFTPPRKGASPFSPRSDGLDSILKERILRYR